MVFSAREGEVVPGFFVVGSWQLPLYLLDAPEPVLFDGGVSFLAERYIAHLRELLGGRWPQLLCLTHAHFDHCGAVAALCEAFPGLQIAASRQANEILCRPSALERIARLNEESNRSGVVVGGGEDGPPFHPFAVTRLLQDGDVLHFNSELTIQVFETPGHTRDFLSYYIPERKILVASEAAGCIDGWGRIVPEFAADYDDYLISLQRLSKLDVEVLCPGHREVYVGPDAREFFQRSIQATEDYRRMVEELLAAEGGDEASVVARIKAEQWDPSPSPKQPEGAYLLNTAARVRSLSNRGRTGS